jgi:hypothetical protein
LIFTGFTDRIISGPKHSPQFGSMFLEVCFMKKFSWTIFAVLLATLLCGFLPAVSSGDLITIGLTGRVDVVGDPQNYFGGQIQINDMVTGTYTYDTSVLDSEPCDPSVGAYWHYNSPCGVSVFISGFNFGTDPNNVRFSVGTGDNYPGLGDIYSFSSRNNLPLPNGVPVESIIWQITDSTGLALSSDALPTTAPNLDDWDMDYGLNIKGPPREAPFGIKVDVTSVKLIPEPATLFLIALGIAIYRYR